MLQKTRQPTSIDDCKVFFFLPCCKIHAYISWIQQPITPRAPFYHTFSNLLPLTHSLTLTPNVSASSSFIFFSCSSIVHRQRVKVIIICVCVLLFVLRDYKNSLRNKLSMGETERERQEETQWFCCKNILVRIQQFLQPCFALAFWIADKCRKGAMIKVSFFAPSLWDCLYLCSKFCWGLSAGFHVKDRRNSPQRTTFLVELPIFL